MDADAFTPPDGEVRVWSFALAHPPAGVVTGDETLAADERARAHAFHFARDRDDFVAAHATLRCLLGRTLRCAPAAVRFIVGAHGKPRLANGPGGDWSFNLSHSHGRALVAIARGGEVGVDLEAMRAEVDCAGIVASHFSPAERAAWAALPAARQRAAFFHGWARKEAYVKARGDGLSHPPDAYTVDLDPAGEGALLADATAPDATARWTVRAIRAPEGFAAAVAYSGPARVVQVREI
jgi:4'-phosphopantetheinyl transferase